jgi:hypothetical protein
MITRLSYAISLMLLTTFVVCSTTASACSYPSPGHSEETSTTPLQGNDCKSADTQYGTPTYTSCEDARYVYYSETQHQYYSGLNHSANCTHTYQGSCQACGVPYGGSAECAQLVISTYANYHSLWDKVLQGYAYVHLWYNTSTWQDCNCGYHGC